MKHIVAFFKILISYLGIVCSALAITYPFGLANVFIASLMSSIFLGLLTGSGPIRKYWIDLIEGVAISNRNASVLVALSFLTSTFAFFYVFDEGDDHLLATTMILAWSIFLYVNYLVGRFLARKHVAEQLNRNI